MSETIRNDLEKVWDTPAVGCPFSKIGASFDPFDHRAMTAAFAQARQSEPVFYSAEMGCWFVTRYEDVLAVLRDPERFSAANANTPITPVPNEALSLLREGGYALEGIQVNCDPPRHTRIRSIASQLLNNKQFSQLEPIVRSIVSAALDGLAGKTRVDLVADLTYELPAKVIFHILGIPEADAGQIKTWSTDRLLLSFSRPRHGEQVEAARNLLLFWHYCVDLVASRVHQPGKDYASELLRLRGGDDKVLTVNEINSLVFGLLFAGHETTTSQSTSLLHLLLGCRDSWAAVRSEPALIPNAVEESLRMNGAVANWRRLVKCDVEIGGVRISKDSQLVISFASANRDEVQFPEPDTYNIRRPNARRHLTFGNGIHMCLGAPLARLEMKILVEELTQRYPECRLAPHFAVDYARAFAFRAPKELLVDLQ